MGSAGQGTGLTLTEGSSRASLCVFGVDSATGSLIAPPKDLDDVVRSILGNEPDKCFTPDVLVPPSFGVTADDPFDPHAVGWTAIVGSADPDKSAIADALRPLARHRGCPSNWLPLEYPPGTDLDQWMNAEYNTLDPVPRFVLLAGSPRHLPFALQVSLACVAYVGRLDFSSVDSGVEVQHPELFGQYVQKIFDNERGRTAPTDREVVMWATNAGIGDPTLYSRHVMAGPLADRIEEKGKYTVTRLFDEDATSARLSSALTTKRPRLVFTASHGNAVKQVQGVDEQAARNGALVGQDRAKFGADNLPEPGKPFAEGGIIFSFACFGYGTPATSGYTHWWPTIAPYAAPFELVSALPKAAVAHPRGPIAYIAHADYAVLHAFTDAARPFSGGGGALAPRLRTFRSTLDEVMLDRPVGAVLDPIVSQLSLLNLQLTQLWDEAHRSGGKVPDADTRLVDAFLRRNDARYYLVLGDPAARPKTRRRKAVL